MKSTFLALLFLICCPFARAEYEPVNVSGVRDKVAIRMGQKATFVFDQRGDRLVNPRPAPKGTKSPVISISMAERLGYTVLRLTSTFPQVVRYHSAGRSRDGRGYLRINDMYGLLPNVVSEEMVKDIREFVLYDFTLRNDKGPPKTNEAIGW